MADDPYEGRRPALNLHGAVRGFRSRPGAPMADPTRNAGATYGPLLKGLTPASNWESMFHNFVTGRNTATGRGGDAAPATGSNGTAASGDIPGLPRGTAADFARNAQPVAGGQYPQPQVEPFDGDVPGLDRGTPEDIKRNAPSLSTIASGGVTPHQERWQTTPFPAKGTSNPLAGTGYESGYAADIFHKYGTPGSDALTQYGKGGTGGEVFGGKPSAEAAQAGIGTSWNFYPKGFYNDTVPGKRTTNPGVGTEYMPDIGWQKSFDQLNNG